LVVPNSEREARRERAKALGRIAYRLARAGTIFGNLEIEGEEKRLLKFRRCFLFIDLYEPRSQAFETEFSELQVSYDGANVLEIRWDRTGSFKLVTFKPGEWERTLSTSSPRQNQIT